jgi:hypothetical protein
VRERLCSILTNTITAVSYSTPFWPLHNLKLQKAGLLLATSGVFVTTISPVPYLDYTSPAPYFLLFISLMMAMIAMLTSGLSMMRWLYADRQGTQEVRVIFILLTASTNPSSADQAGRLFPLVLPLINGHAYFLRWLVLELLHIRWVPLLILCSLLILMQYFVCPAAMLIAGFNSQSTVCHILTAVWLVAYVISVGPMSIEFMWRFAKCLKSR